MSRKDDNVVKFGGGKRPDWEQRLLRNREGAVTATLHNIQLILEHHAELRGLMAMDEFANRIVLRRSPPWKGAVDGEFTEQDATEIAMWMGAPETFSMNVRTDTILCAVEAVARRHKFHPVRDYLEGLRWDGESRVEKMLAENFGAEASDYTADTGRILMVSAAARIYEPGCKADIMPVLEGAQGAGKTRVTRVLFGAEWYAEAMESPASKDFYQSLLGRWGVEIAEMESFTKAEVNKVKQALSAQDDTYRPSYGRYARKFKRQCVFVGTTNDDQYLRDPTGARRFLPVSVGRIDVDRVRVLRDQLWAEAVHRYKRGENYWTLPKDADDQQDRRFMADSWEEIVTRWLTGSLGEKAYGPTVRFGDKGGVLDPTTTDILHYALSIDVGKHGRPEQMRVAAIMKKLKWHQERVMEDGSRQRRWVRPDAPVEVEVPF